MSVKWGTKIAAIFTAAALVLGGVSWLPSAQAAEAQATMTAEEIAKEKELTDAVWDAANWLSIDFEPQQLKDLAVALENLAQHLWQTDNSSDPYAVTNCIDYAETTLGDGSAGDGSDATGKAYTDAMNALDRAKQARRDVFTDMERDIIEQGKADGSIHTVSRDEMLQAEQVLTPIEPDVTVQCSMDNFQKTVTYTAFTDVLSSDWFFNSVKTAVEYGLVKGTSGTTYTPQGNVTVQEAVVMAARLRCVYEWGNSSVQSPDTTPVGNADTWANVEINFAIQSGIIKSTDFADYKANITRAEMAYIFAHTLPESTNIYVAINTIEDNTIPDVKTTDKYGAEIYTLYRAGVLTGGDGNAFSPDKAISRAETAAIVSRLPVPSEHKNVTIKPQEPVAQNNIPSEYMPIYVTLYLTETQYQVARNIKFHMYGAGGVEYPLVSQSKYFELSYGGYNSSLIFAAPKNSENVPVTILAEGDGLTGGYQIRASMWDLGKVSDEIVLPMKEEGPEGGDYSIGLSESVPMEVVFSIREAPIVIEQFKLRSADTPVPGLQVKVTDLESGTSSTMTTDSAGKIYLGASPSGSWQLTIIGGEYTFTNGLTVRDVSVSLAAYGEQHTLYVESVTGAG